VARENRKRLEPGECVSNERTLYMCTASLSVLSENRFVTEERYRERMKTADGRHDCQEVPIIVRHCGTEGGGISREVIPKKGTQKPRTRAGARRSTWRDNIARPKLRGAACAVQGLAGREDTIVLADGRKLPVRHMVVEAERLTPSHGSLNGDRYELHDNARPEGAGGFPGQTQADGSTLNANFTRDYAADTRFQQRLEAMFDRPLGADGAFNPDLVTSITPSVNLGAPVAGCVEGERVVFAGNNRTNILQRMYADDSPEYAEAYRQNVADFADFLEVDRSELDAMRRPVHVRVLDDTATPEGFGDIVELMDAMNSSEAAAAPERDRMLAATANMPADELARLSKLLNDLPDAGILTTNLQANAPAPRALARHLQDAGLVRDQDARAWFSEDGATFSAEGAANVQELLLSVAIREPAAMEFLRGNQRMQAGIARSAPTLVALTQSDPALASELGAAMSAYRNWHGSELKLHDWQNNVGLFSEGKTEWEAMPPRVRTLFGFIDKNRGAQNVWPKSFQAYRDELDRAARGDDLLFGDPPTAGELFAQVFAT